MHIRIATHTADILAKFIIKMRLQHFTVLLTMMLSVINSAVYDVTPHNSNCDHCQDLQHYLLNVNFSASNTQLNFLPGLHHLPTNLIIQNVHNISLIGIATQ